MSFLTEMMVRAIIMMLTTMSIMNRWTMKIIWLKTLMKRKMNRSFIFPKLKKVLFGMKIGLSVIQNQVRKSICTFKDTRFVLVLLFFQSKID